MKFNSQICTTREQSERLLALGLKKETADMHWCCHKTTNRWYMVCHPCDGVGDCTPAWSLHRLIEMTKLKVTPFLYGVEISHPQWERAFVRRANVWDNLCDCIEWLIKEGYFNKEYLV